MPFYKDQNWKLGLPWLYYDRKATEVLNEAKRVKFRASFGYERRGIGIINKFKYKLAVFDLEGTFLGWQDLSEQLLLCRTSTSTVEKLLSFGTTLSSSCNYDLSKLISQNKFDQHKY